MVEQHGLLDAAQVLEELAHGHGQSGFGGLAAHQVGYGQCQHAAEDMYPDFVVGPVVHRAEGDHVRVFELAEAGFGFGLGSVGGDDVGDGPGVAVGEQDPLPNSCCSSAVRAAVSIRQDSRSVAGVVPVSSVTSTSPTQRAEGGDHRVRTACPAQLLMGRS